MLFNRHYGHKDLLLRIGAGKANLPSEQKLQNQTHTRSELYKVSLNRSVPRPAKHYCKATDYINKSTGITCKRPNKETTEAPTQGLANHS